jgi:hypothetical protein
MNERVGQPIVLRPGDGRSIDLGGFQMTVKATTELTDGAFTLLEADEPPNFGPPNSPAPPARSSTSRRGFRMVFGSAAKQAENSTSMHRRAWSATSTN